jgi:predicted ATP-grasp superfamily ATP-dependent carboligase
MNLTPIRVAARTTGTLALLQLALPVNAALTGVALLRSLIVKPLRQTAATPKTILISGGKMTKALALARSFHSAGHRVILVESAKYRLTGHRFSNAVDRFYTVPKPQSPDYAAALLDIVRREHIDVYVPVCSPAASYYDALAKPLLEPHCEVLHADADLVRALDDKYAFAGLAASIGLPVPDAHRVSAPFQVTDFDFGDGMPPYILKSIAYDPLHRLDLTTLPRPTSEQTAAFARSKPMSEDNPWILQSLIRGQEYCTHSTVRDGRVQVYCCAESSPFQINYEMVEQPGIEAWVREFVGKLRITGQVSFDFMVSEDGQVYAIECNPRTHSAITMFYNHPGLANAYLDNQAPAVTPLASSKPTYWIYHELWRLLTNPANAGSRLRTIARGTDAVFAWDDPLPFFVLHHLQIPRLLLQSLLHGKDWIRIDFNIGKLVEAGGD